jgi:hypothetical protein
MAKIRNDLLALTDEHEHADHDGEPCWIERASKLGYLAHAIGIRGDEHWKLVMANAAQYDHDCPGCSDDVK